MHTTDRYDHDLAATLLEGIAIAAPAPGSSRVLVFRTAVADQAHRDRLRPVLDEVVGRKGRWTIDLEDRDRVLRIESSAATTHEVIRALHAVGEPCAELD